MESSPDSEGRQRERFVSNSLSIGIERTHYTETWNYNQEGYLTEGGMGGVEGPLFATETNWQKLKISCCSSVCVILWHGHAITLARFPFLFSPPHTNRRVYAQSSSKVRVSRGSLTLGRLHRRCPPALWNNTFYFNPRAQVVDNLHKKSVMISLCWIACLNLSLPETHLNISFFSFVFFFQLQFIYFFFL